ncbi:MAG: PIN domain-containing protein [Armatimonadota bacterium]
MDISPRHDLPTADALMYATALVHGATLVTADTHLRGPEGVEFIAAEEGA